MESVQLTLRGELAFVTATLSYGGTTIAVPDVLIDTGAASSVINADLAGEAGVFVERADRVRVLRGVGGREFVFVRSINRLAVGAHGIENFEVEIGEMDYGFELGGILGMDFLRAAGAIIDLQTLTLAFGR